MPASRPFARVFGIDIQIHSSWVIILVLIALSLSEMFHGSNRTWSPAEVWTVSIATTVLFFASVLLHELAHSLVARSRGLPVHNITLFVFGGVSQISKEPSSAGSEFLIAVVGPLTSIVIGAALWALGRAGNRGNPVIAAVYWLGSINLLLAGFNLIPGFPLDGGRVLRAIFWSVTGSFVKATRWATQVGKLVAILFITAGLFEVFKTSAVVSGIWLAFIGWFLLMAADQSWKQVEIRDLLANYTVQDLASPFYSWVAPSESLEDYFARVTDNHDYRPSLVVDDDKLVGVVAPVDLRSTSRPQWSTLRVKDVMVPRERVAAVAPNQPVTEALDKMVSYNVSQLPVLEDSTIRGVIRRDRIIQLLQSQFSARPEAGSH